MRFHLRSVVFHTPWRVFALFNHDLEQIFVGASDADLAQLDKLCGALAPEITGWETSSHRIDWIPVVGEFPNRRAAGFYAQWLQREGAFEGTEHYAIGVDEDLIEAVAPRVTPDRRQVAQQAHHASA